MKNIQAKKKLIKMADKLQKMPNSLEREYFIEEVWEQCFRAFDHMKKTSAENYYMSEVRMWNKIEDAIELLEETA